MTIELLLRALRACDKGDYSQVTTRSNGTVRFLHVVSRELLADRIEKLIIKKVRGKACYWDKINMMEGRER